MLGLQQRYVRLPGSPLTAAFTGRLLVAAPLPGSQPVEVGVTFDIVQAPAAFSLPVMQKRPWDPPFQVGRHGCAAAVPCCPCGTCAHSVQGASCLEAGRPGVGHSTPHSAFCCMPAHSSGTA